MTDHLITTPAALKSCPKCDHPVIQAISGGLPVKVDPEPLTITAEIAALIAGKLTYDILVHGWHIYLEWRSLTRIRAARMYTVVATHECKLMAPFQPVTETELAFAPAGSLPEKPPF